MILNGKSFVDVVAMLLNLFASSIDFQWNDKENKSLFLCNSHASTDTNKPKFQSIAKMFFILLRYFLN